MEFIMKQVNMEVDKHPMQDFEEEAQRIADEIPDFDEMFSASSAERGNDTTLAV